MFCTHCGVQISEEAKFCNECGTPTFKNEQQPTDKLETAGTEEPVPEEIGKIDRKAPPKISPVTLLFALIGIVLIIILLHPWHANQDRPDDFEGTQQAEVVITPSDNLRQ